MTVEELNIENQYTERVPHYLKSYENFYTFMKVLSNYLLSISDELKKIFPLLNVNNATGDILVKIAKKLNIEIEKQPDIQEYYNNLKTAILGLQVKRLSLGTRSDLKDTILSLFPTLSDDSGDVSIIDKQNMYVEMGIIGYSSDITSKIIEDYILPRVTGVSFKVNYTNYGENLFALDMDEFVQKDANDEVIRAVDENGNLTDKYVLFTTNDYINFTPISDPTSEYYYNGQKVKAAYYGQVGFGNNENDTIGGKWKRVVRI